MALPPLIISHREHPVWSLGLPSLKNFLYFLVPIGSKQDPFVCCIWLVGLLSVFKYLKHLAFPFFICGWRWRVILVCKVCFSVHEETGQGPVHPASASIGKACAREWLCQCFSLF